MTPERWKRLQALYNAALDTPSEKRAQFIAEQCGDDAELRRELEALLTATDEGTGTLDVPLINFRNGAKQDILPEGTLLLGRFKIVRRVGSGGMGDVYEAIDLELGRIALKTIRPALAQNPGILARFKEEVLLARPISGPNVCHIYELYVPPKGSGCPCAAFLTMEFLDGVTLADRIANSGPVPPKEALKIAAQLCAALQSIHDAGVIHRDLKPRNVMLVPRNGSEQVVVMDFGLAHALSTKPSTDTTGLTVPGTIMGTPAYMAPEQFDPSGKVSPATDIYALGVVLYEMVTGQQPFAASTPYAAAVRRGRRPDSPSSIRKGVPAIWDDVICKCIEYDPECRYQSANEVLAALHQHTLVVWRFSHGQRIALTPRVAVIAGAILLVLLSISGWSVYRTVTMYRPPQEAKRWYIDGVAALRDGTYLKATNSLAMAVKSDPRYALAHARLAEAWAELDSTGEAQQQMLLATAAEQQISMRDEDKRYVDAVHHTLVRDYSAAAQDYEEILKRLPGEEKADGLVDLGRAYEKAGKVKQTMASYEQAAKLRPDDPAPFVHLGIWKSRQRDPAGAEVAFTRAEDLYRAKSNQEGLAEVAYQRGYAANEAGDSEHAHQYLDLSLNIARQISSPQLEARTLSQLSSVEYYDGEDDTAIKDANRAIKIADENSLEYWKADGLMRLGNAYLHKRDFSTAESYSQQALKIAEQNQHPRIEADAAFTLASIRDLQGGKWDEQITLAEKALKYYEDFGFKNMAAAAAQLVVRAEEGTGDFEKAERDGQEQLRLAQATDSGLSVRNAEETLGAVANDLEDYPKALEYFEQALKVSKRLNDDETYERLNCANDLWRLGRYADAEAMLDGIPFGTKQRNEIASVIEDDRAQMALSQNSLSDALRLSRHALSMFPGIDPSVTADLLAVEALSEVQLGQTQPAEQDVGRLLALAQKQGDEGLIAQAELVQARVLVHSHRPGQARPLAVAAETYFRAKGQSESRWIAIFQLTLAASQAGDAQQARIMAKQALEVLNGLNQNWGPQIFQQYITRPDYQLAMRELTQLQTA